MTDIALAVASGNTLGESPLWDPATGRLWWADISLATLHSFSPGAGDHRAVRLPRKTLGSFGFCAGGGFVVAADCALETFDETSGELRKVAAVDEALPNRLNDGKCDRRGRYWVGSMDIAISQPTGSLYRIDPEGGVEAFLSDVLTPNSIAFSPDDRTLYFADTRRFKIYAFDFDLDNGRLSNRRLFRDTTGHPGRPDGATVDSEGFLWSAEFAGARIVRYAPDGSIDSVLTLPVSQPTAVAFGGEGLSTLFITSARLHMTCEQLAAEPLAGHVLMADVGVKGLPEPKFGRAAH